MMDKIKWPQKSQIRSRDISKFKDDPIYKYIKSLCNKTGIISSILYLLTLVVVRPALQRQYEQRQEFALSVLLRLRRTLVTLTARVKDKNVALLEFNKNKTTVDRSIQTDLTPSNTWNQYDMEYEEQRDEDDETSSISNKLKQINYYVNQHEIVMRHLDSTDLCTFQLKLLTNQVESSEERVTTEIRSKSENVTQSIREIKGWFVNGRIP